MGILFKLLTIPTNKLACSAARNGGGRVGSAKGPQRILGTGLLADFFNVSFPMRTLGFLEFLTKSLQLLVPVVWAVVLALSAA
jgi:hypothetical protein